MEVDTKFQARTRSIERGESFEIEKPPKLKRATLMKGKSRDASDAFFTGFQITFPVTNEEDEMDNEAYSPETKTPSTEQDHLSAAALKGEDTDLLSSNLTDETHNSEDNAPSHSSDRIASDSGVTSSGLNSLADDGTFVHADDRQTVDNGDDTGKEGTTRDEDSSVRLGSAEDRNYVVNGGEQSVDLSMRSGTAQDDSMFVEYHHQSGMGEYSDFATPSRSLYENSVLLSSRGSGSADGDSELNNKLSKRASVERGESFEVAGHHTLKRSQFARTSNSGCLDNFRVSLNDYVQDDLQEDVPDASVNEVQSDVSALCEVNKTTTMTFVDVDNGDKAFVSSKSIVANSLQSQVDTRSSLDGSGDKSETDIAKDKLESEITPGAGEEMVDQISDAVVSEPSSSTTVTNIDTASVSISKRVSSSRSIERGESFEVSAPKTLRRQGKHGFAQGRGGFQVSLHSIDLEENDKPLQGQSSGSVQSSIDNEDSKTSIANRMEKSDLEAYTSLETSSVSRKHETVQEDFNRSEKEGGESINDDENASSEDVDVDIEEKSSPSVHSAEHHVMNVAERDCKAYVKSDSFEFVRASALMSKASLTSDSKNTLKEQDFAEDTSSKSFSAYHDTPISMPVFKEQVREISQIVLENSVIANPLNVSDKEEDSESLQQFHMSLTESDEKETADSNGSTVDDPPKRLGSRPSIDRGESFEISTPRKLKRQSPQGRFQTSLPISVDEEPMNESDDQEKRDAFDNKNLNGKDNPDFPSTVENIESTTTGVCSSLFLQQKRRNSAEIDADQDQSADDYFEKNDTEISDKDSEDVDVKDRSVGQNHFEIKSETTAVLQPHPKSLEGLTQTELQEQDHGVVESPDRPGRFISFASFSLSERQSVPSRSQSVDDIRVKSDAWHHSGSARHHSSDHKPEFERLSSVGRAYSELRMDISPSARDNTNPFLKTSRDGLTDFTRKESLESKQQVPSQTNANPFFGDISEETVMQAEGLLTKKTSQLERKNTNPFHDDVFPERSGDSSNETAKSGTNAREYDATYTTSNLKQAETLELRRSLFRSGGPTAKTVESSSGQSSDFTSVSSLSRFSSQLSDRTGEEEEAVFSPGNPFTISDLAADLSPMMDGGKSSSYKSFGYPLDNSPDPDKILRFDYSNRAIDTTPDEEDSRNRTPEHMATAEIGKPSENLSTELETTSDVSSLDFSQSVSLDAFEDNFLPNATDSSVEYPQQTLHDELAMATGNICSQQLPFKEESGVVEASLQTASQISSHEQSYHDEKVDDSDDDSYEIETESHIRYEMEPEQPITHDSTKEKSADSFLPFAHKQQEMNATTWNRAYLTRYQSFGDSNQTAVNDGQHSFDSDSADVFSQQLKVEKHSATPSPETCTDPESFPLMSKTVPTAEDNADVLEHQKDSDGEIRQSDGSGTEDKDERNNELSADESQSGGKYILETSMKEEVETKLDSPSSQAEGDTLLLGQGKPGSSLVNNTLHSSDAQPEDLTSATSMTALETASEESQSPVPESIAKKHDGVIETSESGLFDVETSAERLGHELQTFENAIEGTFSEELIARENVDAEIGSGMGGDISSAASVMTSKPTFAQRPSNLTGRYGELGSQSYHQQIPPPKPSPEEEEALQIMQTLSELTKLWDSDSAGESPSDIASPSSFIQSDGNHPLKMAYTSKVVSFSRENSTDQDVMYEDELDDDKYKEDEKEVFFQSTKTALEKVISADQTVSTARISDDQLTSASSPDECQETVSHKAEPTDTQPTEEGLVESAVNLAHEVTDNAQNETCNMAESEAFQPVMQPEKDYTQTTEIEWNMTEKIDGTEHEVTPTEGENRNDPSQSRELPTSDGTSTYPSTEHESSNLVEDHILGQKAVSAFDEQKDSSVDAQASAFQSNSETDMFDLNSSDKMSSFSYVERGESFEQPTYKTLQPGHAFYTGTWGFQTGFPIDAETGKQASLDPDSPSWMQRVVTAARGAYDSLGRKLNRKSKSKKTKTMSDSIAHENEYMSEDSETDSGDDISDESSDKITEKASTVEHTILSDKQHEKHLSEQPEEDTNILVSQTESELKDSYIEPALSSSIAKPTDQTTHQSIDETVYISTIPRSPDDEAPILLLEDIHKYHGQELDTSNDDLQPLLSTKTFERTEDYQYIEDRVKIQETEGAVVQIPGSETEPAQQEDMVIESSDPLHAASASAVKTQEDKTAEEDGQAAVEANGEESKILVTGIVPPNSLEESDHDHYTDHERRSTDFDNENNECDEDVFTASTDALKDSSSEEGTASTSSSSSSCPRPFSRSSNVFDNQSWTSHSYGRLEDDPEELRDVTNTDMPLTSSSMVVEEGYDGFVPSTENRSRIRSHHRSGGHDRHDSNSEADEENQNRSYRRHSQTKSKPARSLSLITDSWRAYEADEDTCSEHATPTTEAEPSLSKQISEDSDLSTRQTDVFAEKLHEQSLNTVSTDSVVDISKRTEALFGKEESAFKQHQHPAEFSTRDDMQEQQDHTMQLRSVPQGAFTVSQTVGEKSVSQNDMLFGTQTAVDNAMLSVSSSVTKDEVAAELQTQQVECEHENVLQDVARNTVSTVVESAEKQVTEFSGKESGFMDSDKQDKRDEDQRSFNWLPQAGEIRELSTKEQVFYQQETELNTEMPFTDTKADSQLVVTHDDMSIHGTSDNKNHTDKLLSSNSSTADVPSFDDMQANLEGSDIEDLSIFTDSENRQWSDSQATQISRDTIDSANHKMDSEWKESTHVLQTPTDFASGENNVSSESAVPLERLTKLHRQPVLSSREDTSTTDEEDIVPSHSDYPVSALERFSRQLSEDSSVGMDASFSRSVDSLTLVNFEAQAAAEMEHAAQQGFNSSVDEPDTLATSSNCIPLQQHASSDVMSPTELSRDGLFSISSFDVIPSPRASTDEAHTTDAFSVSSFDVFPSRQTSVDGVTQTKQLSAESTQFTSEETEEQKPDNRSLENISDHLESPSGVDQDITSAHQDCVVLQEHLERKLATETHAEHECDKTKISGDTDLQDVKDDDKAKGISSHDDRPCQSQEADDQDLEGVNNVLLTKSATGDVLLVDRMVSDETAVQMLPRHHLHRSAALTSESEISSPISSPPVVLDEAVKETQEKDKEPDTENTELNHHASNDSEVAESRSTSESQVKDLLGSCDDVFGQTGVVEREQASEETTLSSQRQQTSIEMLERFLSVESQHSDSEMEVGNTAGAELLSSVDFGAAVMGPGYHSVCPDSRLNFAVSNKTENSSPAFEETHSEQQYESVLHARSSECVQHHLPSELQTTQQILQNKESKWNAGSALVHEEQGLAFVSSSHQHNMNTSGISSGDQTEDFEGDADKGSTESQEQTEEYRNDSSETTQRCLQASDVISTPLQITEDTAFQPAEQTVSLERTVSVFANDQASSRQSSDSFVHTDVLSHETATDQSPHTSDQPSELSDLKDRSPSWMERAVATAKEAYTSLEKRLRRKKKKAATDGDGEADEHAGSSEEDEFTDTEEECSENNEEGALEIEDIQKNTFHGQTDDTAPLSESPTVLTGVPESEEHMHGTHEADIPEGMLTSSPHEVQEVLSAESYASEKVVSEIPETDEKKGVGLISTIHGQYCSAESSLRTLNSPSDEQQIVLSTNSSARELEAASQHICKLDSNEVVRDTQGDEVISSQITQDSAENSEDHQEDFQQDSEQEHSESVLPVSTESAAMSLDFSETETLHTMDTSTPEVQEQPFDTNDSDKDSTVSQHQTEMYRHESSETSQRFMKASADISSQISQSTESEWNARSAGQLTEQTICMKENTPVCTTLPSTSGNGSSADMAVLKGEVHLETEDGTHLSMDVSDKTTSQSAGAVECIETPTNIEAVAEEDIADQSSVTSDQPSENAERGPRSPSWMEKAVATAKDAYTSLEKRLRRKKKKRTDTDEDNDTESLEGSSGEDEYTDTDGELTEDEEGTKGFETVEKTTDPSLHDDRTLSTEAVSVPAADVRDTFDITQNTFHDSDTTERILADLSPGTQKAMTVESVAAVTSSELEGGKILSSSDKTEETFHDSHTTGRILADLPTSTQKASAAETLAAVSSSEENVHGSHEADIPEGMLVSSPHEVQEVLSAKRYASERVVNEMPETDERKGFGMDNAPSMHDQYCSAESSLRTLSSPSDEQQIVLSTDSFARELEAASQHISTFDSSEMVVMDTQGVKVITSQMTEESAEDHQEDFQQDVEQKLSESVLPVNTESATMNLDSSESETLHTMAAFTPEVQEQPFDTNDSDKDSTISQHQTEMYRHESSETSQRFMKASADISSQISQSTESEWNARSAGQLTEQTICMKENIPVCTTLPGTSGDESSADMAVFKGEVHLETEDGTHLSMDASDSTTSHSAGAVECTETPTSVEAVTEEDIADQSSVTSDQPSENAERGPRSPSWMERAVATAKDAYTSLEKRLRRKKKKRADTDDDNDTESLEGSSGEDEYTDTDGELTEDEEGTKGFETVEKTTDPSLHDDRTLSTEAVSVPAADVRDTFDITQNTFHDSDTTERILADLSPGTQKAMTVESVAAVTSSELEGGKILSSSDKTEETFHDSHTTGRILADLPTSTQKASAAETLAAVSSSEENVHGSHEADIPEGMLVSSPHEVQEVLSAKRYASERVVNEMPETDERKGFGMDNAPSMHDQYCSAESSLRTLSSPSDEQQIVLSTDSFARELEAASQHISTFDSSEMVVMDTQGVKVITSQMTEESAEDHQEDFQQDVEQKLSESVLPVNTESATINLDSSESETLHTMAAFTPEVQEQPFDTNDSDKDSTISQHQTEMYRHESSETSQRFMKASADISSQISRSTESEWNASSAGQLTEQTICMKENIPVCTTLPSTSGDESSADMAVFKGEVHLETEDGTHLSMDASDSTTSHSAGAVECTETPTSVEAVTEEDIADQSSVTSGQPSENAERGPRSPSWMERAVATAKDAYTSLEKRLRRKKKKRTDTDDDNDTESLEGSSGEDEYTDTDGELTEDEEGTKGFETVEKTTNPSLHDDKTLSTEAVSVQEADIRDTFDITQNTFHDSDTTERILADLSPSTQKAMTVESVAAVASSELEAGEILSSSDKTEETFHDSHTTERILADLPTSTQKASAAETLAAVSSSEENVHGSHEADIPEGMLVSSPHEVQEVLSAERYASERVVNEMPETDERKGFGMDNAPSMHDQYCSAESSLRTLSSPSDEQQIVLSTNSSAKELEAASQRICTLDSSEVVMDTQGVEVISSQMTEESAEDHQENFQQDVEQKVSESVLPVNTESATVNLDFSESETLHTMAAFTPEVQEQPFETNDDDSQHQTEMYRHESSETPQRFMKASDDISSQMSQHFESEWNARSAVPLTDQTICMKENTSVYTSPITSKSESFDDLVVHKGEVHLETEDGTHLSMDASHKATLQSAGAVECTEMPTSVEAVTEEDIADQSSVTSDQPSENAETGPRSPSWMERAVATAKDAYTSLEKRLRRKKKKRADTDEDKDTESLEGSSGEDEYTDTDGEFTEDEEGTKGFETVGKTTNPSLHDDKTLSTEAVSVPATDVRDTSEMTQNTFHDLDTTERILADLSPSTQKAMTVESVAAVASSELEAGEILSASDKTILAEEDGSDVGSDRTQPVPAHYDTRTHGSLCDETPAIDSDKHEDTVYTFESSESHQQFIETSGAITSKVSLSTETDWNTTSAVQQIEPTASVKLGSQQTTTMATAAEEQKQQETDFSRDVCDTINKDTALAEMQVNETAEESQISETLFSSNIHVSSEHEHRTLAGIETSTLDAEYHDSYGSAVSERGTATYLSEKPVIQLQSEQHKEDIGHAQDAEEDIGHAQGAEEDTGHAQGAEEDTVDLTETDYDAAIINAVMDADRRLSKSFSEDSSLSASIHSAEGHNIYDDEEQCFEPDQEITSGIKHQLSVSAQEQYQSSEDGQRVLVDNSQSSISAAQGSTDMAETFTSLDVSAIQHKLEQTAFVQNNEDSTVTETTDHHLALQAEQTANLYLSKTYAQDMQMADSEIQLTANNEPTVMSGTDSDYDTAIVDAVMAADRRLSTESPQLTSLPGNSDDVEQDDITLETEALKPASENQSSEVGESQSWMDKLVTTAKDTYGELGKRLKRKKKPREDDDGGVGHENQEESINSEESSENGDDNKHTEEDDTEDTNGDIAANKESHLVSPSDNADLFRRNDGLKPEEKLTSASSEAHIHELSTEHNQRELTDMTTAVLQAESCSTVCADLTETSLLTKATDIHQGMILTEQNDQQLDSGEAEHVLKSVTDSQMDSEASQIESEDWKEDDITGCEVSFEKSDSTIEESHQYSSDLWQEKNAVINTDLLQQNESLTDQLSTEDAEHHQQRVGYSSEFHQQEVADKTVSSLPQEQTSASKLYISEDGQQYVMKNPDSTIQMNQQYSSESAQIGDSQQISTPLQQKCENDQHSGQEDPSSTSEVKLQSHSGHLQSGEERNEDSAGFEKIPLSQELNTSELGNVDLTTSSVHHSSELLLGQKVVSEDSALVCQQEDATSQQLSLHTTQQILESELMVRSATNSQDSSEILQQCPTESKQGEIIGASVHLLSNAQPSSTEDRQQSLTDDSELVIEHNDSPQNIKEANVTESMSSHLKDIPANLAEQYSSEDARRSLNAEPDSTFTVRQSSENLDTNTLHETSSQYLHKPGSDHLISETDGHSLTIAPNTKSENIENYPSESFTRNLELGADTNLLSQQAVSSSQSFTSEDGHRYLKEDGLSVIEHSHQQTSDTLSGGRQHESGSFIHSSADLQQPSAEDGQLSFETKAHAAVDGSGLNAFDSEQRESEDNSCHLQNQYDNNTSESRQAFLPGTTGSIVEANSTDVTSKSSDSLSVASSCAVTIPSSDSQQFFSAEESRRTLSGDQDAILQVQGTDATNQDTAMTMRYSGEHASPPKPPRQHSADGTWDVLDQDNKPLIGGDTADDENQVDQENIDPSKMPLSGLFKTTKAKKKNKKTKEGTENGVADDVTSKQETEAESQHQQATDAPPASEVTVTPSSDDVTKMVETAEVADKINKASERQEEEKIDITDVENKENISDAKTNLADGGDTPAVLYTTENKDVSVTVGEGPQLTQAKEGAVEVQPIKFDGSLPPETAREKESLLRDPNPEGMICCVIL